MSCNVTADPNPSLPLRDAATHTGLSVPVLRRHIRDGVLPATMKGNRYEVTVADLNTLPERLEERRRAREKACQEELEAVARRIVGTFPPLSEERKKQLSRLLGSVPVRRTLPTHIHCEVCGETWEVPDQDSDRIFREALQHANGEHPGDEPSSNIKPGRGQP
ncbi:helix-turn-helix domain-containing protein [Micrococcaceae bacterium Sec7.4]